MYAVDSNICTLHTVLWSIAQLYSDKFVTTIWWMLPTLRLTLCLLAVGGISCGQTHGYF